MAKTHLFLSNNEGPKDESDLLRQQEEALRASKPRESGFAAHEAGADYPAPPSSPEPSAAAGAGGSLLGKDLVINGSIVSASRIQILGQVNGNVDCQGDILIAGGVTGDINALSVKVASGNVKGNITCKSGIEVDESSHVQGDIAGESIVCGGKIEGNLSMQQKTELKSSAIIQGDVIAKSIRVEEGAALTGQFKIGESPAPAGSPSPQEEAQENP